MSQRAGRALRQHRRQHRRENWTRGPRASHEGRAVLLAIMGEAAAYWV